MEHRCLTIVNMGGGCAGHHYSADTAERSHIGVSTTITQTARRPPSPNETTCGGFKSHRDVAYDIRTTLLVRLRHQP